MSIFGEISYDLVMDDNMPFVEGTFRLQDGTWQVIIISKDDILTPQIKFTEWDSGVTGIFIRFPQYNPLNATQTEALLSSIFDVKSWSKVQGPDSMGLR
jgi:hypothetical protein